MWTVHGHFIGTFGQDIPWNLGSLEEECVEILSEILLIVLDKLAICFAGVFYKVVTGAD